MQRLARRPRLVALRDWRAAEILYPALSATQWQCAPVPCLCRVTCVKISLLLPRKKDRKQTTQGGMRGRHAATTQLTGITQCQKERKKTGNQGRDGPVGGRCVCSIFFCGSRGVYLCQCQCAPSPVPSVEERKKERKTNQPREGWEDGTPPPHRDFKERSAVLAFAEGCSVG